MDKYHHTIVVLRDLSLQIAKVMEGEGQEILDV